MQMDETTGVWTFDGLYAAATVPGEFTLRFSNHWTASVDQIIKVTLGVKGYKLVAVLPDSFGTYAAALMTTFEDFTVKVVDGGGNDMGSADRFSDSFLYADSPIARTLTFSSDTLELTGDATKQTADGTVLVDALSCFEPKVRMASRAIPTFEFRGRLILTC